MSARLAAHLRMGNTDSGYYALMCTHCGTVYVPTLPISIDMMLGVVNQFAREHRRCECPESGPVSDATLLARADVKALLVR